MANQVSTLSTLEAVVIHPEATVGALLIQAIRSIVPILPLPGSIMGEFFLHLQLVSNLLHFLLSQRSSHFPFPPFNLPLHIHNEILLLPQRAAT